MSVILDHVVLLILIVISAAAILFFNVNPLLGTLLFFGLPTAYLLIRKPSVLLSSWQSALVFGFIYSLGFEYINEASGAWMFPLADQFVFPGMFFGIVPGDVMVWYVLWALSIVVYYEYFIDRPTQLLNKRRVFLALALGLFALSVVFVSRSLLGIEIIIPYSYAVLGTAALIPAFVLFYRRLYLVKKCALTIPFFAVFFIVMEFTALHVGYWEFTGQYVASIQLMGHSIPIEEIVFWIVGSSFVMSAYHELFLDDAR